MKNHSTKEAKVDKQAASAPKKKKYYSRFQYKDNIFEVGDVCRFYNEQNDLIGKILAIASTDTSHPDFGKLKIQW
jgi:hypothetical protein